MLHVLIRGCKTWSYYVLRYLNVFAANISTSKSSLIVAAVVKENLLSFSVINSTSVRAKKQIANLFWLRFGNFSNELHVNEYMTNA